MKLTAMQIAEAQKCKTPEEVVKKAKAHGIEMTLEEAKEALAAPAILELDEDELAAVSGGGCGDGKPSYQTVTCGICGNTATYYRSSNGYHYYSCKAIKTFPYDTGHITVY